MSSHVLVSDLSKIVGGGRRGIRRAVSGTTVDVGDSSQSTDADIRDQVRSLREAIELLKQTNRMRKNREERIRRRSEREEREREEKERKEEDARKEEEAKEQERRKAEEVAAEKARLEAEKTRLEEEHKEAERQRKEREEAQAKEQEEKKAKDEQAAKQWTTKTLTGQVKKELLEPFPLQGQRLPVPYIGESELPMEQYDNVVLDVLALKLPEERQKLVHIFGTQKDAVLKRRRVIYQRLQKYERDASTDAERAFVAAVRENVLTKLYNVYGKDKPFVSVFDDDDYEEEYQFFEQGGIVEGKKGEAVPIVAHAGELVVPVQAVPAVLKSGGWVAHVKAVAVDKGISYKDALKIAKGTYIKVKATG